MIMKVIKCPQCAASQRVLCLRTKYRCECGAKWSDHTEPTPEPEKPDYNLTSFLTPYQVGIIRAGKEYKAGVDVCYSKPHPVLMGMATKHAQHQAKLDRQGHQLWPQRYEELTRKIGGAYRFSEICAETWKRQEHDSPFDIGTEFFRCWEQSPGHWSIASKRHTFWGVDTAIGNKGIWYACIITGDKLDS